MALALTGAIGGVRVGSGKAGQRSASTLAAEETPHAILALRLAFSILVLAGGAFGA